MNSKVDFLDYLKKEILNNHLSHAYLIEMNNFDDIDFFINRLAKIILCPNKNYEDNCSECSICNLIDNNNYPDFKIIEADGSWIKKEQLLNLKNDYSTESLFDNKKIYIIKDASKLNAAAGNTILKFLEEPNPGIIAILLTKNRYKVLETIVSRCRVFIINENNDYVLGDSTMELIKALFVRNKGFLAYNDILNIIPNNKSAKEELQEIEKYFFTIINNNSKIIDELVYLSNDQLFKIILIIENSLLRLDYNLNYKLFLDRFLIETGEVIR